MDPGEDRNSKYPGTFGGAMDINEHMTPQFHTSTEFPGAGNLNIEGYNGGSANDYVNKFFEQGGSQLFGGGSGANVNVNANLKENVLASAKANRQKIEKLEARVMSIEATLELVKNMLLAKK